MIHPTDTLPTLLGCGINSRAMSKRPDGTLYRQVTEDIYYIERTDGTVWAEVAHLPEPVALDREVLIDAAAQWANALMAAVREANLAAADEVDPVRVRLVCMAEATLRLLGGAA